MQFFELFPAFSKTEMAGFLQFVQLNATSKESRVVQYITLFRQLVPRKPKPDFAWEEVAVQVKQQLSLSNKQCKATIESIFKWAKKYIAILKVECDQQYQDLAWLEFIGNRTDAQVFQPEWEKVAEQLESQTANCKTPDHLRFQFDLNFLKAISFSGLPSRQLEYHLKETMTCLKEYHELQSLQVECALINLAKMTKPRVSASKILKTDEVPPSRNELKELFESIKLTLILPANQLLFTKARKKLVFLAPKLENSLFQEIFIHLSNHCARRINAGDDHARQDFLRLNQEVLQLINNNQVQTNKLNQASKATLSIPAIENPWYIKNLIQLAAKENQIDFATHIFENYKTKLPPEIQFYCEGVLHYYEFHLEKAESLFLNAIGLSKDRLLQLDARIFLLLAQLCLHGYGKQTYGNFQAFRVSINRSKMLPPQRLAKYQSFKAFYSGLYKLDLDDKDKLAKYQAQIVGNKVLKQHLWVLGWLENCRLAKIEKPGL